MRRGGLGRSVLRWLFGKPRYYGPPENFRLRIAGIGYHLGEAGGPTLLMLSVFLSNEGARSPVCRIRGKYWHDGNKGHAAVFYSNNRWVATMGSLRVAFAPRDQLGGEALDPIPGGALVERKVFLALYNDRDQELRSLDFGIELEVSGLAGRRARAFVNAKDVQTEPTQILFLAPHTVI